MSAWIEHVRKMAKDKGISYSEAMKNPDVKAAYAKREKQEGEKIEVEKVKKEAKPKKQRKSSVSSLGSEKAEKAVKVKKVRVKKTEEQKEIAKQNKKEKKSHEKKEDAMGKSGEYSAGVVKNPENQHKDIKNGKAEKKPKPKVIKEKK